MTAAEPTSAPPSASITPFNWRHLPDCRAQLSAWQRAAALRLLCRPLADGDLRWRLDLPMTTDPIPAPNWIELRDGVLSLAIAVRFDAWADFSLPDEAQASAALRPLLWACRHHRLLERLRAAGERQWRAEAAIPAPARELALCWRLESPTGPVAGGQILLPDDPATMAGRLASPPLPRPGSLAAHARWLLTLPRVYPGNLETGAICLLPARAHGALAVGLQRLPLHIDPVAGKATVDAPGSWTDFMTHDIPEQNASPRSGPLQLEIAVVLQRQRVRLDALQALAPGAVLELPRLAEDMTVALEVEGQWLADGRIVRIGDHLGVQITALRPDGP